MSAAPVSIRVGVKGVAGRMGQRIAALLAETPGAELTSATERKFHAAVGKDVGEIAPGAKPGLAITDSLTAAFDKCDVLIDFTVADSTMADLDTFARAGKPLVIGTTGFRADEMTRLRQVLAPLPYVLSPNMSIGVNVLFNLVRQAAVALGDDYDIEITEAHHRFKKDSPSGTAAKLAEVLAEVMGRRYPADTVFRQRGIQGARTRREIGMQVIRAGDIVGDHTVMFGGLGERLELTHRAHTRDTFARGAIKAALWIPSRSPGAFDMQDVLDLRAKK